MRAIVGIPYNLLRLLTWPLWALYLRLRRSRARWVSLTLRGSLDEIPKPTRWLTRWIGGMRRPRSDLVALRRLCARLSDDRAAEGLLLRLEKLDAGYATLGSLRELLLGLRARGKRVVCYLPTEASQRELYVAAAADRVLAMPHAAMSALGPIASRTYIAPLLARMGIRVVVTAEGRYKSAADPLVCASMSDAEREQLEAIVHTLLEDWRVALAARPSLGIEGADALLGEGLFGAERARELGIVDETSYDDQLAEKLPFTRKRPPVAYERYMRTSHAQPKVFTPLRAEKRVVVVRLVGAISERGGSSASPGIDLHGTTATLRALRDARHVAGVILYIDSPGGSAIVSELLHREIARLATKKPVVTWMGNVAASGGYYMASASHRIVARATTLTGSIGVISALPVAEALFARFGVHRDVVRATPYADLMSLARAPNAAEEALLRAETSRFYARFLDVVAEGRKQRRDVIALLAEGRVWSGRDAHVHGLVDTLGGYDEARRELDTLEGSTTKTASPEPLWIAPTLKARAAPPPFPEPTDPSVQLALAMEDLRALWELMLTGERVLAYVPLVPSLH